MPPRVLIVDDDRFVRVYLRECLQELDCEIEEASDGEQALAIIDRTHPSLVLLDLMMPKMSGLDVLAKIRAADAESRVLVISSMDSQSLVEHALQSGAAGFISKPFHPVEISTAVKEALEAR